ncbi:MAG: PCP reductase family protein, partial [Gemmatimonadetes bacterium]|nr:PCP reductase family protein [Gemmatimonadota bacterium]
FQEAEPAAAVAGGGSVAPVEWSAEARERLERVPSFVRGMVKRIYADYARERGIPLITPGVMDQARSELGLEGM